MINVNGLNIDYLPMKLDDFIGILLHHEYPVMTIYRHNGLPLIRYWVDCNDDDSVNRYFVYTVRPVSLKRYLNGGIGLLGLLNCLNDGFGYLIDIDNTNVIHNVTIVSPINLPDTYKPRYDSIFELNNGVDTEQIFKAFDLDSIEEKIDTVGLLSEISKDKNIEIINLHLTKGEGIGYGKINTKLLGETLIAFDNLYREVAFDEMKGSNRGEVTDKKDNKDYFVRSSTEIFMNKAASYSIFIKPSITQLDMFENVTESSKIAKRILELINNTSDKDLIGDYYPQISDFAVKSYQEFLKEIISKDINLSLNWFNPQNNETYSKDFSLTIANQINDNINSINTDFEEKFNLKGKFTALNCDTRYFTFKSHDDESYKGYFDTLIKDSMPLLNFTTLYEIIVNRTIKKEAGRSEPKISDIILSCQEVSS
ncbi:hypothetical protein [Winogradskyella haliclonae]|uniref:Uncharacterized protein n=1 Tax=Winogradskyella haliclonae TaxID=2048558 RepID=A0ABQ2BWP5_9FLAO|nr:hypothetical protein [Winogradskyella haliclonae]GGI56891.1 hypothetical protein GCM10011444_12000 [Winogradskyella haliclonae]